MKIQIQQGSKKDLGITIIVTSIILIVYVLFNGIYNKKLGFSIINPKHTFYLNDLLQYSENIMTSIIIIIITILYIILIIQQDFQTNIYGIVAILSLVFTNISLIFMNYKNNVALITMFFVFSYIYILFTNIQYSTKYSYHETNELNVISFVAASFFILTLISIGLKKISKRRWNVRIFNDLGSIFGLVYLIVFIVHIYFVSIYPSVSSSETVLTDT